MKIYIETDGNQATGAYLSYTERSRRGHIQLKEVELPTEEEIIDQSMLWDPIDQYHQRSFRKGAEWLLSKLK